MLDWTINVPTLITALLIIVGGIRYASRVDLVLFGDKKAQIPGLLKDVSDLKDDTDQIFAHFSNLGPQFRLNRRSGQDRRE